MANVPLYGGPKVQASGIPNAYLNAGAAAGQYAGGEIVGDALQGLGQKLKYEQDKIAAQEKARADRLAVNGAVNKLKRAATDAWYGKGGLNDMQGEAVLAAGRPAEDAFASQARDIGSGLTPEQQDAYALYADDEVTAFHNDLTRHIGAARIAVEDKQLQDARANAIDGAALDAASGALILRTDGQLDEASVGREREYMEGQISEYVDRNTDLAPIDPAAWKQQLTDEARSEFHKRVIDNAMPAHPREAIAYFDQHKGEMDAAARVPIEKTVDRVRDDMAVRDVVMKATFANFDDAAFDPPIPDSGLPTLTEREDATRAEIIAATPDDPERQNKALAEFKKFTAAGKQRAKAIMNERHQALSAVLNETGDINRVRARSEWDQVTPEVRKSVEHESATRLKADREDEQARAFYGLLDQATSSDPTVAAEFRDMALLPSRPYMSKSQWDELSSIQQSMKGGASDELSGVRTRTQAVTHWVDKLYPDAGTQDAAKGETDGAYAFRSEIDAMVRVEQGKLGREMTPPEIDALLGPLFSDVVYKGWASAFDNTFPLASIGDIPKPTLLAIQRVLVEDGEEVSEENIRKRYAELAGGR